MKHTHTSARRSGSNKPKRRDNSNKDLDLHLGRLETFFEDYKREVKKITGKLEGKFPPFRNSQEAIVFGHSASISDIIRVWNLKVYLEREKQKRVAKRQQPTISKRVRLNILNRLSELSSQIQFCREAIQSFEERFFAPTNMYPFRGVYLEWFEGWKRSWREVASG